MRVSIDREFCGGYCRTTDVAAVIEARKARAIGKAELRLFFALLEHNETGRRVPVDVILNKQRGAKKRMTEGQQERARKKLECAIAAFRQDQEPFGVKLPRRFVRGAAKGHFDASEMLTALCYFQRRMPQRAKRKCLVRGEKYGRLSVRTVRSITGLCLEVIVKALRRLRQIGLLALVWRPMVEIKRWGRLFVDGAKVSVSYHKPEQSRSSAPSARLRQTETVRTEKPNKKEQTLPKNSFSGSPLRSAVMAFAAKYCPDHPLLKS